jgi:ferredoxin-NADP reductase
LREQFRDFSITSSPEELPRLVITYREGVSEFKKALSGLSPGVEVTLTGPKGVFTLPKDERAPVVFIAGGVGITPFMSMIRSALARQSSRKMSLYYFNHTRESAPYLSELEGYSGQVRFVPVFGPLTEERLSFGEDTAESIWYVAGPPAMVSAAMKLLSSHAVEDARIKTEEFTGYA